MKYIKTFESLKPLHKDDLENLQNGKIDYTYMVLNETDDNYYKVTERANNWYYKIKLYYKKPGYITYCFLKTDGPQTSQFWIEEDKLMIPSKEEIEQYELKKMQYKYNL